MMTFDEYLTTLVKNNVGLIEMAKQMYDREILIGKLRKEIADLKEELEESRACEDPGLRAHKKFSKAITEIFNDREIKHSMYSAIADRERREGMPMEELEDN